MKLFFFFVALGCPFAVNAQEDTARIQKGYFSFQYDNDFFNATDRYFTQGIRLEFAHTGLAQSPILHALVGLSTTTYAQAGVAVEQQCFTPRSIRVDSIYKGERPFGAVMFMTFFKNSYNSGQREAISSRLDLGIVGPCAVCEQEQKGLHKALDNIQPLGWEYQLGSDAVINYTVQYEKALYSRQHFAFTGTGRLRAGTLYTDASLGFNLQAGWMPFYFSSPARTQPFRFYVFIKGQAKAVAYNATLQGGLFGHNDIYTLPDGSIERWVGTGTGGMVLAWKRISLEYTRIFVTPEFKGGLAHGWGHCDVRWSF